MNKELLNLFSNWNCESECKEFTIFFTIILYLFIVFLPLIIFIYFLINNFQLDIIRYFSYQDLWLTINFVISISLSAIMSVLCSLMLRIFVLPKQIEKLKKILILSLTFVPSFFFSFGYICFHELYQTIYIIHAYIPQISYPKGMIWAIVALSSAYLPLAYILSGIGLNFYKSSAIQAIELFCDSPIKFLKILFYVLKGLFIDLFMLISWLMISDTAIFMHFQFHTISSEFITSFIQGTFNNQRFIPSLLLISVLSGTIGTIGITRFITIIKSHTIQNNFINNIFYSDTSPNLIHTYSIQYLISSYASPKFCFLINTLGNLPLLLIIIPYVGLIHRAYSKFHISNFSLILTTNSILFTLYIGIIVALLSTIISYFLGNWIINSTKTNTFTKFIISVPFFLPNVISSFIIANLGNIISKFIDLKSSLTIWTHLSKSLPFCLFISIIIRKNFGKPECIEACILFINKFSEKIKIEFNRIIAIFLFALTVSYKELDSTLLTIPAGFETLNIRMYNLIHYGATAEVATFLLINCLIFALLIKIISNKINS